MVDYKKFLREKAETLTGLYLGGLVVFAGPRTLRLKTLPGREPGWYTVTANGRNGELGDACDAGDLSALPKETGPFVAGYVALSGGRFEPVELLGASEPEVFSPVRARRHSSGALILEETLFEGDAEGEVRAALEEGRGIPDTKGVSAALRSAFAFALARAAAREQSVPVSAAEIRGAVLRIASGGSAVAASVVADIARARAARVLAAAEGARLEEVRRAAARVREAGARAAARGASVDPVERADRALTAAGARLVTARRLQGGQLEVGFVFMGERFVSVVDAETLHVFDAGICLAGADEDVTLESLPSVIREAIEDDVLVITRRAR